MVAMREIGQRLQEEQKLTADEISWLVIIAQAILRAFTRDEGKPMRSLAAQLNSSPTTFYKTVRLAVQVLMWLYRRKQSVTNLVEQLQKMTERLAQADEAKEIAQKKRKK